MGSEREQFLPEALFDLREFGRLPGEGGPMDLIEGGNPFAVVPSEEEVDGLVGVDAEELADDLHGENLRASEGFGAESRWRMRRPLSRSLMRQKTATMKVLRSAREDVLYAGWFARYRA